MRPSWNRFDDLVSGFVPDEESRVAVVMMDEIVDGRVQFLGGAMDTAAKPASCERSEPAPHQVQP
jgi:hypothetical protein